jgi:hypothetical protein
MILSYGNNILLTNIGVLTFDNITTPTPTPSITPTQTLTPTPTITPTSTLTPTPTPSLPSSLRILVLGDTSVSTVSTNLSNEIVTLGYPTPSMSSVTISTTYSGVGLSPSLFDVVLYYTNSSQVGSSTLPSSLSTYVSNGGNLVTGTFIWNLRPTGFNYNLTPYVGPVNQSNNSSGNMTVTVSHPITNGVGTGITNNNVALNNIVTTLQSGATTIATYTTNGVPYVGINTVGTSRIVGLNIYIGSTSMSIRPNLRRLVTNAVLWAGKKIN